MRQFKADLLARENAQMMRMAQQWLELELGMRASFSDLAQDVYTRREAGERIDRATLYRMERYGRLLRQMQAVIVGQYAPYVAAEVAEQQRRLLRSGIDDAAAAIQAVQAEKGVGATFDRLPVEAVERMVGLTGDGSPLLDVLRDAYPDAVNAATNALIDATARGTNPRETADRMMQAAGGTALNRALVIARTEQLRVYREAGRAQYMESGLVRGFRRLATHDIRTCPACLGLEGEFYDVSSPLRTHPQCRCAMIPVVKGYRELSFQYGEPWLRSQPEATQRAILGKGGYEAWRHGVPLSRFASITPNQTWGDTVRVTPVKDLGR